MKFMNDPVIQEMIHVRGNNIPGLNFYPEKEGKEPWCVCVRVLFVCVWSDRAV